MRSKILTVFGVLLVATSTIQIETAAARSIRKLTRVPHPQPRDALGSVGQPSTAQSNHSERHGLSPSTAVESKSCDVFWCYEK